MSDHLPPYTCPYDLAGLSERGVEVSFSPDAAERARMASWLGVLEVPRLDATIRLELHADGIYGYAAEFAADVVQSCVVTLDPVPAHHAGTVVRRYRVIARAPRRSSREIEIGPEEDEDAPEVMSS